MSLESKLIFALGLSLALVIAAFTVAQIVIPAFAKVDAAFDAASAGR